jgi:hypothetical protein
MGPVFRCVDISPGHIRTVEENAAGSVHQKSPSATDR